jgi:transcriptional regulator GlxA family with amidase domain
MSQIQFGILMVPYQTIDVAGPVDILSCCSKALVEGFETLGLPGAAGMTQKAIDIKFHHVNETMDPVTLTAATTVLPTTTFEECPDLDYLLVGGPDPATYQLPDTFADFIRKHVKAGKRLFTTCTGALAISSSGVLDGRNATTNHGCVDYAKIVSPNVKWSKEKRWVIDGNLWTAGGATAGMDMLAYWVMQNYGMDLAKLAFGSLDYHPRDVDGNSVALS